MITATTIQQRFQHWELKMGLSPDRPIARPTSVIIERIHLQAGQVCTLPAGAQSLCILSGRLWTTHTGKDEIVYPGQTIRFASGAQATQLWALQQQAVVFELQIV